MIDYNERLEYFKNYYKQNKNTILENVKARNKLVRQKPIQHEGLVIKRTPFIINFNTK